MQRQTMIATALALVSLGAACTSSEPMSRPMAAGAAELPPFTPYVPDETAANAAAPGAGLLAAAGSGGAAGQAGPSTCALPPSMPPSGIMGVRPDLSGPVTSAAAPPRPLSGGTLLVLHDGSAAVASDPDRDVVTVVDLKTRTVRARLTLQPDDEPGRLVEDAQGLVHVALRRGGAVVTLDPATGRELAREAICTAPRGLAYETRRDLVHVACADGQLVSLRASGGRFRAITLERDLRDVVVTSAGTLLVSTFRRAEALVVDEDGNRSGALRPPARSGSSPIGLPRTLSAAVAWRMVPLAGTGALMLHQRGVDDEVAPAAGGYAAGKGCDGIVESATTVVSPGAALVTSPALALVTLAVDVAVSADGQRLALAAPGNAHTPLPQIWVSSLAAVTQGGGGCVSPDASAMIATSGADAIPGQVVAVAFAPDGTLVSQSRAPAALWTDDARAPISLSDEQTADTGHELFHLNAGGGIACASCHPEGGEDGRVWNFACLGPRRTQSLRGGLSGTEPFHWDGDMATFPQLVKEVFVGRMSGPQPSDEQTAALLHWLDSIPELPNPPPAVPAAVERGRSLFGSAGCTACHAGARLTNNLTVDVGTGGKLQVPSLRGVGWRAPYLHTGCAPTLADRFGSCGGGDSHGHTSTLGPADVADLTAYLETL